MKLVYVENSRIKRAGAIFYDAYVIKRANTLEYAHLWIEYDIATEEYTPCKWGQRLQPCQHFAQAQLEMVAFKVIERLGRS